jgi:hypothetical protein
VAQGFLHERQRRKPGQKSAASRLRLEIFAGAVSCKVEEGSDNLSRACDGSIKRLTGNIVGQKVRLSRLQRFSNQNNKSFKEQLNLIDIGTGFGCALTPTFGMT